MISNEDYEFLTAAKEAGDITGAVYKLVCRLGVHFIPPKDTTWYALAYTVGTVIKTWTDDEACAIASYVIVHRKSRWFPTVGELVAYRKEVTAVEQAAAQWVDTYWPTVKTDTIYEALQAAYRAGAAYAHGGESVTREKLERLGKHLLASAREGGQ